MNPMWAETDAILELKKMGMLKKTCGNCEQNLEDLIGEPWCTEHDIDRLPLSGCGYWRARPDLGEAVESAKKARSPVDGAETENTGKEVRGWKWRIMHCR